MNPAILAYINNRQQQDSQQEPSNEQNGMSVDDFEGLPITKQPMPVQSTNPFKPFDIGIRAAVDSSKTSMSEMSERQMHNAIRKSMLTFAQKMQTIPKQRGFGNNLNAIGQALTPAMMKYGEGEEQALQENEAMAREIFNFDNILWAQKLKERKLEEQQRQNEIQNQLNLNNIGWGQNFKERKFEEQQRQNEASNQLQYMAMQERKADDALKQNKYGNTDLELNETIFPKIKSDRTYNRIAQQQESAALLVNGLEKVSKKYNQLIADMKAEGIDPNIINLNQTGMEARNLLSNFTKDPKTRKIVTAYKDVHSQIEQLAMIVERLDTGKALTDFTAKYANEKKLFPKIDDAPDIFKQKFNTMFQDAQESYDASSASLGTGRIINRANYFDYKKRMQNQSQDNQDDNNLESFDQEILEDNYNE